MGSSDKLSYLLETKENIKQAILNKGVEVTDSDTFRSYASKIALITAGGGGEEDLSVELAAQDAAITELEEIANSLPDAGSGGGGVTDGLARYIAGDITLTELVPSDFGSITSLAKYAFYKQDGTKSNPVNLRKIGLPNTITKIGINPFTNCPVEEITGIDFSKLTSLSNLFNTTPNLAKINDNNIVLENNINHDYVFYQIGKAKDLKITVNLTNTSTQTFKSAFGSLGNQLGSTLGITNNEIIVNGNTTNLATTGLSNMFYGTRAKKVVFTDSTGWSSSGTNTPFNYMFGYCYIDEVVFPKATKLYSSTIGGYRMFQYSKIGRLRLPALTTTLYVFYGTTNPIEKIFLGSNCALSSTADIQTSSKYFFPYDNYYTYAETTNWITTFNTNVGTTDAKMFAYKEFNVGENFEESWNGQFADDSYRTYTVEWFEDDDFTTPVSGTALNTATYYARFTLTEYTKEVA